MNKWSSHQKKWIIIEKTYLSHRCFWKYVWIVCNNLISLKNVSWLGQIRSTKLRLKMTLKCFFRQNLRLGLFLSYIFFMLNVAQKKDLYCKIPFAPQQIFLWSILESVIFSIEISKFILLFPKGLFWKKLMAKMLSVNGC